MLYSCFALEQRLGFLTTTNGNNPHTRAHTQNKLMINNNNSSSSGGDVGDAHTEIKTGM
jgi:hypothetical protein